MYEHVSKIFFSTRLSLFQTILGTRRNQFWQLWRTCFRQKTKNFSLKFRKWKKNLQIFSEKILFSNFFLQKVEFFLLNVRTFFKKWTIFKYKFLLELFLWTSRLQFRQTYWKFIGRRPKSFHSISENLKKTSSFSQLFWQKVESFSLHVRTL